MSHKGQSQPMTIASTTSGSSSRGQRERRGFLFSQGCPTGRSPVCCRSRKSSLILAGRTQPGSLLLRGNGERGTLQRGALPAVAVNEVHSLVPGPFQGADRLADRFPWSGVPDGRLSDMTGHIPSSTI